MLEINCSELMLAISLIVVIDFLILCVVFVVCTCFEGLMETYWPEARAIFFFKKIYRSIVKFNSL